MVTTVLMGAGFHKILNYRKLNDVVAKAFCWFKIFHMPVAVPLFDGEGLQPLYLHWNNPWNREIWFPRLIVVPVYSQEVAGVRKEKERLTAAADSFSFIRTRAATLS